MRVVSAQPEVLEERPDNSPTPRADRDSHDVPIRVSLFALGRGVRPAPGWDDTMDDMAEVPTRLTP